MPMTSKVGSFLRDHDEVANANLNNRIATRTLVGLTCGVRLNCTDRHGAQPKNPQMIAAVAARIAPATMA
jgi:hypothetical protein